MAIIKKIFCCAIALFFVLLSIVELININQINEIQFESNENVLSIIEDKNNYLLNKFGNDTIIPTTRSQTSTRRWQIEILNLSGDVINNYELQIDSEGNPHICYKNEDGNIKYAIKYGDNWEINYVNQNQYTWVSFSFVLDIYEKPHLCYFNYNQGKIFYTFLEGSNWKSEIVGSEEDISSISLKLDSDKRPHIAYYNISYNDNFDINIDLKYGTRLGNEWKIETVESEGNVGWRCTIEIMSNNNPIILYYKSYEDCIRTAKLIGDNWKIEKIELEESTILNSQKTIDSENNIHLCYNIGSSSSLKYSIWNGDEWKTDILEPFTQKVRVFSLVLDSEDQPHCIYFDETNMMFKYAFKNGNKWIYKFIEIEILLNHRISMSLDLNNYPHVCYYNEEKEVFKYAKWTGKGYAFAPSPPTKIEVTPGKDCAKLTWQSPSSDGGSEIILYKVYKRVNLEEEKFLLYVNSSTFNFQDYNIGAGQTIYYYVTAINDIGESDKSIEAKIRLPPITTNNWQIETIDSSYYAGWEPSIAIDSSGIPHISYREHYNGSLKYAKWTDYEWNIEIIDSRPNVGYGSSIQLDSHEKPHIVYSHGNGKRLHHAQLGSNGWSIETINIEGMITNYLSIAIDSSDTLHICYFDEENNSFKYVKWKGNEFNIETIDPNCFILNEFHLVLNSFNEPHVIYCDSKTHKVKFALLNDTEWQIEIIGNGSRAIMSLNSSDIPIAYFHPYGGSYPYGGDMKFGKRIDNNWIIEKVYLQGGYSIGQGWLIDSFGNLHSVSYYSDTKILEYGKSTGTHWIEYKIYSNIKVPRWISLALDSHENPQICYHEETNFTLGCAKWIGGIMKLPPSPPTNLTPSMGKNYINLSWGLPNYNGGSEILNYQLYRSNNSNQYSLLQLLGNKSYFFNDTSVKFGQNYSYYITAINKVGESITSQEISLKVVMKPSPPKNLKAELINGTNILLSWEPPIDDEMFNITKYKIYRSTEIKEFDLLINLNSKFTEYLDTNIQKNKKYYYFITAENEAGESEPSNEVTIELETQKVNDIENSINLLLIIIIVIIIIISIPIYFRFRKRKSNLPKLSKTQYSSKPKYTETIQKKDNIYSDESTSTGDSYYKNNYRYYSEDDPEKPYVEQFEDEDSYSYMDKQDKNKRSPPY